MMSLNIFPLEYSSLIRHYSGISVLISFRTHQTWCSSHFDKKKMFQGLVLARHSWEQINDEYWGTTVLPILSPLEVVGRGNHYHSCGIVIYTKKYIFGLSSSLFLLSQSSLNPCNFLLGERLKVSFVMLLR